MRYTYDTVYSKLMPKLITLQKHRDTHTMAKKESQWFSHDCDAADDPKLVALIAQYGMAGYGQWWRLVETLRKARSDGYKLKTNTKFAYAALAKTLMCSVDEVKDYIYNCIEEFELLKTDGEYIWSDSLIDRMAPMDEKKQSLSERGRKGAEVTNAKKSAQASAQATTPLGQSAAEATNGVGRSDKNHGIIDNTIGNKSIGNKRKEKKEDSSNNSAAADFSETSQFKKFLGAYDKFILEKTGTNEKFSVAGRVGLKSIISHFENSVKKQNEAKQIVEEPQQVESRAYDGWLYVLYNFDNWDAFHQKQLKIEQINSNLTNILLAIKTANNGQPKHGTNNFGNVQSAHSKIDAMYSPDKRAR